MIMRHITIMSSKADESVKFYEEIAGLKIVNEIKGKGPFNIVFLANGQGETCIEIIDNPEAAFKGTGITIGFETDDVEKYRTELEEKGYEVTPIAKPNPFTQFFFVKDPDGLMVQFINK